MIEYLQGTIDNLTPATATIDCHGVGYLANISVVTFDALKKNEKQTVRLYIHEAIREDAYILYGFATREERSLFLLLISVSGIGGNTARAILSFYRPSKLCDIILGGDQKSLADAKGIGPKTAQRIIVEIKDKVSALGIVPSPSSAGTTQPAFNKQVHDDAIEALKALGYAPAPVTKVVRAILKDQPDAAVEHVLRMAFKML